MKSVLQVTGRREERCIKYVWEALEHDVITPPHPTLPQRRSEGKDMREALEHDVIIPPHPTPPHYEKVKKTEQMQKNWRRSMSRQPTTWLLFQQTMFDYRSIAVKTWVKGYGSLLMRLCLVLDAVRDDGPFGSKDNMLSFTEKSWGALTWLAKSLLSLCYIFGLCNVLKETAT